MNDITSLALRMKAAAQEATQGEWWSDSVENDGFSSYAVYGADNRVLLDTLNSSAACIQEEYDDEGHTAWDEVGQRNAEFVAVANPANVLVLTAALEARDKQIAELSGIISLARKFTSKCAGFGDVGAAEFSKIIDRASGVSVKGE